MINYNYSKIDIYQSYIGVKQLREVSEFAIPYDASHNTERNSREYELFKEIFHDRISNPNPWGLVSWKFKYKTAISFEEFLNFAELKFKEGCDCVFINPMIGTEAIFKNVWEQGALAHKNLNEIESFIMKKLPVSANNIYGKNTFSFCNYFIATPRFWKKYFKFVDSITYLLNKQTREGTRVGSIWSGSAHYSRDLDVTMKPFVIERLFSTLLKIQNDMTICDYKHSKVNYIHKFGTQLGAILFELSELKNKGIVENNEELIKRWHLIRSKIHKSNIRSPIVTLDDPPLFLSDLDITKKLNF